MSATIGVITFPGTLDDVDAARAARTAQAAPKPEVTSTTVFSPADSRCRWS